jgi:hypothetical protein
MPIEQDQTTTPSSGSTNGAAEEQPRSLREIAESSWDEVVSDADMEGDGSTGGQDKPLRDNLGRFTSRDTGEQSAPDPALQTTPASPTPQQPVQPQGNQPPQHWPAEDKATFARLPQEGQQFLLKRHAAMEADYTAKTQAAATAVGFTQAVAPIFEDPVIRASLANVDGRPLHPVHAIEQWAEFHKRAMSPDINTRVGLIRDLMQRLQLDPAAVFGQGNRQVPGLSEQDLADPAIRYFADHVGRTAQEVQSLRAQLQDFHRQAAERTQQETLRVTRWGIDSYADEKDGQGRPLRPHFDTVLPQMIELYQANPNRDLNEAYATAVWMHPQLRQTLIQGERQSVEQRQQNQRASAAARTNVRGRTSPVTKPDAYGDTPKGMRATIAAAADEVGL